MNDMETIFERQFRDILPDTFKPIVKQVSFDYEMYMKIVVNNLKHLYGEIADPERNIKLYYHNDNNSSTPKIEDIREVSEDELNHMITEDAEWNKISERITTLCEEERRDDFEIARLLGIIPSNEKVSAYNYLVDFTCLSDQEKSICLQNAMQQPGYISAIISSLSQTFVSQLKFTYDPVGTLLTQPKQKYFYRGENAFYGTTRPSIYRGVTDASICSISNIVRWIRLYECLYFISKFNIIPQWNNTISSVDAIALAQHYGVYTQYIDITSNLKTALFFACCKYGKDDKWHPLDENDFNNSNSRPKVSRIGGDSRYAILYRVRSELIDLLWSSKKTNDKKIIRPIGYQPFMRCSSQYGYALVTDDYKYDMMNDPMFEKIKIRLNTELCQKIYHEMHEGNDIYPFGDIPYIPKCINDINNTNIFTEEAFIWLADLMEWNPDIIRHELKRNGYDVRKEYERLHYHKIEKINKNYTLDKLIKKMEIAPKISPLFTI